MPFRHLLVSLALALALTVALPRAARADAPVVKDVAAIGDCLRKQDKKGGDRRKATRRPAS